MGRQISILVYLIIGILISLVATIPFFGLLGLPVLVVLGLIMLRPRR